MDHFGPRKALRALRQRLLAKPVNDAKLEPIYVGGLFSTASGIGESARLCAAGLERSGFTVKRLDFSDALNQRDLYSASAPFPLLPRSGTLILHLNAPETETALVTLGLYWPRRWRIIGYWAWELTVPPPDWSKASDMLSEVWTPSRFSADVLSEVVSCPVKVVPHAVIPPGNALAGRRPTGDGLLRILTMADGRSSLKRKNIVGAIDAFRLAFPDRQDVRLTIKLRNTIDDISHAQVSAIAAEDKRIVIADTTMTADERWELICGADIYLSLHRSEGFGLTLAEAMSVGVCVIATAYSGNLDFMSDASACLVPARRTPVGADAGPYSGLSRAYWAEPDLDVAAAHLRRLADDAAIRRQIGENARQRIARMAGRNVYKHALGVSEKSASAT